MAILNIAVITNAYYCVHNRIFILNTLQSICLIGPQILQSFIVMFLYQENRRKTLKQEQETKKGRYTVKIPKNFVNDTQICTLRKKYNHNENVFYLTFNVKMLLFQIKLDGNEIHLKNTILDVNKGVSYMEMRGLDLGNNVYTASVAATNLMYIRSNMVYTNITVNQSSPSAKGKLNSNNCKSSS